MSAAEQPLMTRARRDRARGSSNRVRVRTAVLSVVVGTILLGLKYSAYQLTGSTAILSDTLESIVNVIAALFALGGLVVAGWPADRNHPYGHGKVEFFGAAFEGGMIALAAALIIKEAGEALALRASGAADRLRPAHHHRHRPRQRGARLVPAAAPASATARSRWSPSGMHVLSDFWTSVATAVGLGLVRIDRPRLARCRGRRHGRAQPAVDRPALVRHAAGGLLDEEDVGLLERLVQAINTNLVPGRHPRAQPARHPLRPLHRTSTRTWWCPSSGPSRRRTTSATPSSTASCAASATTAEIAFHVDPCRRQFCASCEVDPCPIRVQPFVGRSWITLDEAVRPDPGGQ